MTDPAASPDRPDDRSSASRTHRSLLDRARARDPGAWERMVALYAPLVAAWCRRWGLRDEDAADVLQEVFQAVAVNLARFRRERSGDSFRGWLRTIARNKVHDLHRRRQKEPEGVGGSEARAALAQLPELPAPEEEDPGGIPDTAFLHRALDLIRDEFEPRTWEAFWQTTVNGRAAADVAADLGMTPGGVRVAKSRVLHRLRAELAE
jgi:RNA polymerase sigma-70 factor (ECF subfamily)